MTAKIIKIPGTDHLITVEHTEGRVVARLAGRIIADSRNALILREAKLPPIRYIPREDVDMTLLERTDHATYCPYKGDASYYNIPIGGSRGVNAAWSYEAPHPAVTAIQGHIAFYPDRMDCLDEWEPEGRAK